MQAITDTVYFLCSYLELYIWLLLLAVEARLFVRRQKLLQGCTYFQKSIRIAAVAVLCLFLACRIKELPSKDWYIGVPGGAFLNLALRLLLVLVLAWPAMLALKWVFRISANGKVQEFVKRNKWGLILFALMLVPALLESVPEIEQWATCWYLTDYSMGFGSRFFIGSVCRLLFGSYVTETEIRTFIYSTELLINACLAYMSNRVYLRAEPEERPAVVFLTLCFLYSPFSFFAMFDRPLFGRLEIYNLLLCLAAVLLFRRLKSTWLKYTLVAVVGCVCNAIYQGFMFLHLPLLLMPMIQDIFGGTKHPLRRLGAAAAACVPIGASFLLFQFCSYTTFPDDIAMAQALQQMTDINIPNGPLHYELFMPLSAAYNDITKPTLGIEGQTAFEGNLPGKNMLLFLVLMLPVVILVTALYHSCFAQLRAAHINKWKTPYPYFLLVLLVVLPQYVLNIDWGRWTVALGTNLFFGMLYLFYTGNREMVQAMRRLAGFIKKRPILAVMTLLYLTSFEHITSFIEPPAVLRLQKWF